MPTLPSPMLEAILPLLCSADPAQQAQGRELVRTWGDQEVLALLDSPAQRNTLRTTLCLRRGLPLPAYVRVQLPLHEAELPHLAHHPEVQHLTIAAIQRARPAIQPPRLPEVQGLRISGTLMLGTLAAPRLEALELVGCPGETLEMVSGAELPHLQRLLASALSSPIPASVSLEGCAGLEWLRLSLWLQHPPQGLTRLSRLRWLTLDNSPSLRALPEDLGALGRLERLVLAHLGLEQLPASVGQLQRVWRLNLSGTPLRTLPEEIGDMAALRWLSLHRTRLERLPERMADLSELRMLDISRTAIRELPRRGLERLQAIDISDTPIEALPPPGALPRLRQVFVDPSQQVRLAEQARERGIALRSRY